MFNLLTLEPTCYSQNLTYYSQIREQINFNTFLDHSKDDLPWTLWLIPVLCMYESMGKVISHTAHTLVDNIINFVCIPPYSMCEIWSSHSGPVTSLICLSLIWPSHNYHLVLITWPYQSYSLIFIPLICGPLM